MALQGNIESFPVSDILRLLHGQDQTGRLRVEGDRGTLSIFMESGRLVAAEHNGEIGITILDAMVELIRSTSGSFAFDTDVRPVVAAEPEQLEAVLSEAEFCVAEWEEIEADVPSLEMWAQPVDTLTDDSITINAEQWRLLVAMGSGASLATLRTVTGLRPLEIAREAKTLADLGGIKLVEESEMAEPVAADGAGGLSSRFAAANKSGGNGNGNGNGNGDSGTASGRDGDAPSKGSAQARGALTSLASSLDRRLTDLGPPPGLKDRRVFAGSILDARDITTDSAPDTESDAGSEPNANRRWNDSGPDKS